MITTEIGKLATFDGYPATTLDLQIWKGSGFRKRARVGFLMVQRECRIWSQTTLSRIASGDSFNEPESAASECDEENVTSLSLIKERT